MKSSLRRALQINSKKVRKRRKNKHSEESEEENLTSSSLPYERFFTEIRFKGLDWRKQQKGYFVFDNMNVNRDTKPKQAVIEHCVLYDVLCTYCGLMVIYTENVSKR